MSPQDANDPNTTCIEKCNVADTELCTTSALEAEMVEGEEADAEAGAAESDSGAEPDSGFLRREE